MQVQPSDARPAIAPAGSMPPSGPSAVASEHLAFRLGGEEYGVDILCVQEIRGYASPTRIANAPAFIKGVMNLRGTIVPIVDLRLKLGLSDARHDETTVTIVLNIRDRVIGVVVDSVSDVIKLRPEQIRPAPAFNSAVRSDHIVGLVNLDHADRQRLLILVDIERLMTHADMGLVDDSARRQSH